MEDDMPIRAAAVADRDKLMDACAKCEISVATFAESYNLNLEVSIIYFGACYDSEMKLLAWCYCATRWPIRLSLSRRD